MSIELRADGPEWIVLPDRFPRGPYATREAWVNAALEYLRELWGDNLDAEREPLVRGALEFGLEQVEETDSIALQFWPVVGLANAVVHITAIPSEDPAGDVEEIVRAARAYGPSLVDSTSARHLGAGVDIRWVEPMADADDGAPAAPDGTAEVLAGMLQVFPSAAGAVAVRVDPTLPHILALLEEPLATVLDTAVVRERDHEWPAAAVELGEADETWDGTAPTSVRA